MRPANLTSRYVVSTMSVSDRAASQPAASPAAIRSGIVIGAVGGMNEATRRTGLSPVKENDAMKYAAISTMVSGNAAFCASS